jgi:hypothetical protein
MARVPANGSRKPTQKKSFSLNDYKKKTNVEDVPLKPVEWIKTSPALQEATGLPGFPMGYTSLSRGFSNTGKSTSMLEGIVGAQKRGILPIVFDLENNIGEHRLEIMGFDWNNAIKVDTETLLYNFGRKRDKNRSQASIEDLAMAINFYLDEQERGNLPMDLLFAIDSIGVLNCLKTINAEEKDTANNNMWNAGAYEAAFKGILNTRIPASRKETKEFTNTIIAVQKIWIDSQGAGVVKHKGGEAFYFGSRLIYHHGGIATHGTRAVAATSKGKSVKYGVETKVDVAKNHIDGPLGGLSMEGKLISTVGGFVAPDSIDQYKKDNLLFFRKVLGEELNPDEIMTKYHQIQTIGDDEEQHIDDFNDTMKANFGKTKSDDINVDKNTGEIKE